MSSRLRRTVLIFLTAVVAGLMVSPAAPVAAHSADLVDQDWIIADREPVKFVGTPNCSPPFCPYVHAAVNWGDGTTHPWVEIRGRVEVGGGYLRCGRVMVRYRNQSRGTIAISYSRPVCTVPFLGFIHPNSQRFVPRQTNSDIRSIVVYVQESISSRGPWRTTSVASASRG